MLGGDSPAQAACGLSEVRARVARIPPQPTESATSCQQPCECVWMPLWTILSLLFFLSSARPAPGDLRLAVSS